MLKSLRPVLLALSLLALMGLLFGAGYGLSLRGAPAAPAPIETPTHVPTPTPGPRVIISEFPQEVEIMGEAWEVIFRDFVDRASLDPEEVKRQAIEGMIKALNDPFSAYIDAQDYSLETSFGGSYEGIGAYVDMEKNQIVITSAIPGSPAEGAGIKPGDVIVAIDGESTQGMTLAAAILRIRGPRGTAVRITIRHLGEVQPVEVTIVREEIKLTSVILKVIEDNIAHLRITYFSSRTSEELVQALKEARAKKVKGIILDLRNNPGGLLETVVQTTSQFLKEGVVLYEQDADGRRTPWPVRSGGLATDLPIAILVNQHSASGSEVMGGALQDYKRGPVIGEKTTGKGTVDIFRELSDGSAIYISIARWLTPKGTLIQGEGLTPDIVVEMTIDDQQAGRDPQLQRAIEYIKKGT